MIKCGELLIKKRKEKLPSKQGVMVIKHGKKEIIIFG